MAKNFFTTYALSKYTRWIQDISSYRVYRYDGDKEVYLFLTKRNRSFKSGIVYLIKKTWTSNDPYEVVIRSEDTVFAFPFSRYSEAMEFVKMVAIALKQNDINSVLELRLVLTL